MYHDSLFFDTLTLINEGEIYNCTQRYIFKYKEIFIVVYDYFCGNHEDWILYFYPKKYSEEIENKINTSYYNYKSSFMSIDKIFNHFSSFANSLPQLDHINNEICFLSTITKTSYTCTTQFFKTLKETYCHNFILNKDCEFFYDTHFTQYLPIDKEDEEYYKEEYYRIYKENINKIIKIQKFIRKRYKKN